MALTGALIIVAWHEQAKVVATAVLFLLFSLGLSATVLALSRGTVTSS